MTDMSRRDLMRGTGLTALSYSRVSGANDRVHMGYIGLGNRGAQVHDAFLEFGDAETTAICDLRQDYLDFAVKRSRGTPKQHPDYRALIDDKNVDAVVIATPDHWHALMMIDACNAGKDVYVEKPLSLTVFEGRKMVEAAERTRRVVQVGTQRRSSKMIAEAADYVRSGELGQVTVARCYDIQNEWPNGIGNFPDEAPPTDEQWDRWLGPAPKIPYNRNRAFYKFRWFYNYSGGQLTNFGVHLVDTLRRCLQLESPKKVTAIGGHWAIKDNREIPDTLEVLWEYDGPTLITFTQINSNAAPGNLQGAEMELRGTKGTMYIHENRWEVVPERVTESTKPANTPLDRTLGRAYSSTKKPLIQGIGGKGNAYADIEHARNFLDCVKSRAKCNADILTGHISTSATLIANIAHKTELMLKWDAKAERFTNSQAANRFLHYQYRAPYKLG